MINGQKFLFEVSWEVCNQVGGIYTVLRSKLTQAAKYLKQDYILIGPIVENNKYFVEGDAPAFTEIRNILAAKNITARVGYWDTEGQPTVILIDFRHRYKIDLLLYSLWTDFGVDSLVSSYDYQEPVLFATLAGEVIAALAENLTLKSYQVIAQFHEWMCGAGLLYLKKNSPNVATVFTTHATVLGRALANDNRLMYNLPKTFDPIVEARRYGVPAKASLERISAREADCFTTVSNITADEANIMLGKYPDKIVLNGIDVVKKQQRVIQEKIPETRVKLRQIASKVIGQETPANALIFISSGRYEFHNKGFDVILRSLSQLETILPKEAPPIVMFFLVAASWHTEKDSLLVPPLLYDPEQAGIRGIATHKVYDPANDRIIRLCNELNLRNPEHKIHIVFSDAYLNGSDGVFNMLSDQALAAADLSIFPSFYEPWGYTPLESISYSTPTVTTDLAGFGAWAAHLKNDITDAVYVLPRKNVTEAAAVTELSEYLLKFVKSSQDANFLSVGRKKAYEIACLADWQYFYQDYLDAYEQAANFNALYHAKFAAAEEENKFVTTIHEAESALPRFRSFQYECPLPEALCGLRTLAFNFWWSWHEEVKILFQKIDPELWENVQHNPAHFLNLISTQALQRAAENKDYMWLYNNAMQTFAQDSAVDLLQAVKFCSSAAVSTKTPIAYFCMEYGIDELLPIYSGGLGILAGDYLKTMSDLKVPMVAVGLFYRQGYFKQVVDAEGEQQAIYESWDTNKIPMRQVNDANGKALLTTIEILGRTVYIRAWEVKVGYVNLYLLDTNLPENAPEDREITDSLYGGSREVRLLQEKVLGVGGTRFLIDKLDIHPVIYHLNEGHSAFLLLERIRNYCHRGLSFDEACEAVRCSSIFTTHTPVAAGNETFPEEMIKKYFVSYAESMGISMERLLDLAKDVDPKSKVFSMTALALRFCLNANAVSKLHGKVARQMWQNIWPGFLASEIPITEVTNGVHLATWLGSNMRLLYEDYLARDWLQRQDEPVIWEKISAIPAPELWKAHQAQKERLINLVKEHVVKQYSLRNENKTLINASLRCLNVNTLLIGLSRRFTSYKRNDLLLRDQERLVKILTNEKRPIVILISGKAHPADGSGRDLIREVIETLRIPAFAGHIIFLEEYNIGLAKALVQGVDVWLNTPILGHEACGTSGMKVSINGGINFSTRDGWWDEAYNTRIGWEIPSLIDMENIEKRNDLENMYLLNTLESDIASLYYDEQKSGFNQGWVSVMKASVALVTTQFNTYRMARDYINNLYCPAILQLDEVRKNDWASLKGIVAWRQDIIERFNTVKIKAILINGIKDGKITSEGLIKIKLLLFSGKLRAKELKAEFVLIKSNGKKVPETPTIIQLRQADARESGVLTYVAEYKIDSTGFYSYAIRVFPYNSMLFRQQDAGIVYWG